MGNGSLVGYFEKAGRTVRARVLLTVGSTTVIGTNPSFSLPATRRDDAQGTGMMPIGTAFAVDSSAGSSSRTGGTVFFAGSSTATCTFDRTDAGANTWTPTFPWTWAEGDTLGFTVEYEAGS